MATAFLPGRRTSVGVALWLCVLSAPAVSAQQSVLSPVAERVVTDTCDRHVVLLGELPSHGEAAAFGIKAEIVRGLVERCGFDVLLFEAGIYDFIGFEEALAENRATFHQMNRAVGRFWWTEGLAPWRRWLFAQAGAGRLVLGGIDDQPSVTSDYARTILPDLVASALPDTEAPLCRTAIDRNLFWRYDDENDFGDEEQALLARCARLAATEPRRARGDTVPMPQQAMLERLSSYYSRQASGGADRDSVMHRTVGWHRARRPDTSKVIVWTATVHASRRQGVRASESLGSRLAAELESVVATIGFTAYSGVSSRAGMERRPFAEAPPESLEARAVADGDARSYLNAAALRDLGAVPSRLYGRFMSADWSTHFDGVVVVREEASPRFEPWDG